jgi:hypothetical protein
MSLTRRSRLLHFGPAIVTAVALVTPTEATAKASDCPRKSNDAQTGKLDTPIQLSPTTGSAQRQLNFDTSRDPKRITHITVTADKPLPDTLNASQINFDAVLNRTGDTLESKEFPDPTYTNPTFSPDRKSISFTACLDPDDIAAGKYVGSVTVSGPAGLGAATVNLTVNAKNGTFFKIGWGIGLAVAFVLLLVKDAARLKEGKPKFTDLWRPFVSPIWWVTTLGALAVAFGAVLTIYSNDPAWGAGGWVATANLIGAVLSAIGAQSILTAFTLK